MFQPISPEVLERFAASMRRAAELYNAAVAALAVGLGEVMARVGQMVRDEAARLSEDGKK